MGIQDRDWYRKRTRAEIQEDKRSLATAPPLRATAVLAALVAVVAGGTLAVGAVMAYATGEPIVSVLRDAAASMAGDLSHRTWTLPAAIALVGAFCLALVMRGRLQVLLIWGIVAGIGYALSDALLSRQQASLQVQIAGSAGVELHRSHNGHYLVDGSIQGVPARFMVDTGASLTAIPADLARKARVVGCVPQTFSTAAGSTAGCVARVSELTFAGFRFVNTQVAVLPKMQDTALLGMDVLGRVHIEQRGRVLRLTAPTKQSLAAPNHDDTRQ